MSEPKPPEILDKIVDTVLAYHPKPKSKTAKTRKRKATKIRHNKDTRPGSLLPT
jgi:hypothetical protein